MRKSWRVKNKFLFGALKEKEEVRFLGKLRISYKYQVHEWWEGEWHNSGSCNAVNIAFPPFVSVLSLWKSVGALCLDHKKR